MACGCKGKKNTSSPVYKLKHSLIESASVSNLKKTKMQLREELQKRLSSLTS
jgi:uncharacterized protein YdcH (DUF465 family)